jgi:hypothetical protein
MPHHYCLAGPKSDLPRLEQPALLPLMLCSEAPETEPSGGTWLVQTDKTAMAIPLWPLIARSVLVVHERFMRGSTSAAVAVIHARHGSEHLRVAQWRSDAHG